MTVLAQAWELTKDLFWALLPTVGALGVAVILFQWGKRRGWL